jgi:hypothetical protein
MHNGLSKPLPFRKWRWRSEFFGSLFRRIVEIRRFVRPHHKEREKHDEARKDQDKLESSDACFHSGDP